MRRNDYRFIQRVKKEIENAENLGDYSVQLCKDKLNFAMKILVIGVILNTQKDQEWDRDEMFSSRITQLVLDVKSASMRKDVLKFVDLMSESKMLESYKLIKELVAKLERAHKIKNKELVKV